MFLSYLPVSYVLKFLILREQLSYFMFLIHATQFADLSLHYRLTFYNILEISSESTRSFSNLQHFLAAVQERQIV